MVKCLTMKTSILEIISSNPCHNSSGQFTLSSLLSPLERTVEICLLVVLCPYRHRFHEAMGQRFRFHKLQ